MTRGLRERMAARNSLSWRSSQAGVSLIELIIVIAILSILAMAALPVARFEVKRRKDTTTMLRLCHSIDKGQPSEKQQAISHPRGRRAIR